MIRFDTGPLLARAGVPQLLQALAVAEGRTRLVGGVVRDGLLGETTADVDLATQLRPTEVIANLEQAGIRVVATGLAHGTVTAIVDHAPYEITTLREDVETFGRHAAVRFTNVWQADAARRDFTINALYAHPQTGEIFDYFGGLADLRARHVRFIGDPLQRIGEDHLRILRFFRFSARFSDHIDSDGLQACHTRANDLMALSRERIRDELLKLLALPQPQDTVATMLQAGILQPILPEIPRHGDQALSRLIAAEAGAGASADGLRRLAALLPADSDIAAAIASRLRCSRAEKRRLVLAACRTVVPADPLALAYDIGPEAVLDRLLLTDDARARHWVGPLANYQRPRLPITGGDLIALGLPPGPAVSHMLAQIERQWIASGFPPERAPLLAAARGLLQRD